MIKKMADVCLPIATGAVLWWIVFDEAPSIGKEIVLAIIASIFLIVCIVESASLRRHEAWLTEMIADIEDKEGDAR